MLTAACTLLLSAAPLTKKYSLKKFSALRWEVYPPDVSVQKPDEEVWSVGNPSAEDLLLIAPYQEENFELAATIRFSEATPHGSVGIVFNVQDNYEDGELPTYMLCRLSTRGETLFATVQRGAEYAIEKGRVDPGPHGLAKFKVRFVKRRDRLSLTVNGQKREFRDDTSLPAGGFGFLIAAETEVELSDFYFAKYHEMDIPFKGVDVKKLFPKEQ